MSDRGLDAFVFQYPLEEEETFDTPLPRKDLARYLVRIPLTEVKNVLDGWVIGHPSQSRRSQKKSKNRRYRNLTIRSL